MSKGPGINEYLLLLNLKYISHSPPSFLILIFLFFKCKPLSQSKAKLSEKFSATQER